MEVHLFEKRLALVKKSIVRTAVKQILLTVMLIAAALLLFHSTSAEAAIENISDISAASNGLWRDMEERGIPVIGERLIVPEHYRLVALDQEILSVLLSKAPAEGSEAARQSALLIYLPLPDGTAGRFRIVESPVMAPELAAKFPEIKTFSGQGVDDPSATVRFDNTPQGFHAMILSPSGRIFIDPYSRNDTAHYISYYTRDHISRNAADFFEYPLVDPGDKMKREIQALIAATLQKSSGAQLRTYRLAVAATGEYTAFFGGTVPQGMAAIVTAVNRVTGIYEAEAAIRLQLVANNDLIVYTDSATDPYTNGNGNKMLGQNQTNIDTVIGTANYDIGHVFSTGGGGVAYLGVVCQAGWKAQGVTGSSSPVGDAFWVDYVAHEMGHQFGANHTFNSTAGNCGGGNRNASTAYEPGSASTIMGYAGICGADDLQPHSDAYFHTISFDEIVTYTTVGSGNTCPVISATGNNPPVPDAGSGGFTIPANTPFTLTGSATDPDGDSLTYNWEEFDLGAAGPPDNPLNPPFFRSWVATTSPSRTFPRLSDLLNNTTVIGEVLPNTTRALTFRMTVRDNRANGGGVNYATLSFNVTTGAGPFQITSPNTAITWTGNSTQPVTWNVANTTAAPVSCPNVGILLSTDGGFTFPITLAASTPNDGSQTVTVPNTPMATARVKVYCTNNIFFDISASNFTITASPVSVTVTTVPSGRQIEVDGVPYTAPKTFTNWVQGDSHTISITTSPQPGPLGTQYVFSSWNIGSSPTQMISTPIVTTTYTANFTTQYLVTTAVSPSGVGTVSPDCSGVGCWYNSGSSISLSPIPSGGNTFSAWTGDISSLDAPLSFTLNGPKNITANFNSVPPNGKTVRIAGLTPTYFDSIAAAYAAAIDNDVIQAQTITPAETLTFNRTDIPEVTLKGGYNATYSNNTGQTVVSGPLTIESGTVVVDNIIIK